MSEKRENILCAAVKYRGRIYTMRRHHPQIRFELRQRLKRFDPERAKDGFKTTTGRFVDRAEAARIAMASGQTYGRTVDLLYSEDIQ